jgi:hypothetical protein
MSRNRTAMDPHPGRSTAGSSPRVAIALALAFVVGVAIAPMAADAAQSVSAFITDPVNQASQARVDGGSLRVGDGSGGLTVDGTVAAQPVLPANVFQQYVRLVGPTPQEETVFGPAQPGEGLAISSLTIRNQGPNPVEFTADLFTIPDGEGCDFEGGGVSFLLQVRTGPEETIHLPFPQPLLVSSSSQTWCLIFSRFGNETLDVTVVGFET